MLETSIQWTCDGCGEGDVDCELNRSKKAVRLYLRSRGWRSFGRLDYCPKCVKNGNAKRREIDMNH